MVYQVSAYFRPAKPNTHKRPQFEHAYRCVQFQGGRVIYWVRCSRRDPRLLQPRYVINHGTPVAIAFGRGFTDWQVFDDVGPKKLPVRPTNVKKCGEVRHRFPAELALAFPMKLQRVLVEQFLVAVPGWPIRPRAYDS